MTTTTIFGDWTLVEQHSASLKETVVAALGDYGADYDIDGLCHAFRIKINDELPDDVSICGDQFFLIVPCERDSDDVVREINRAYESVNFWELAANYEYVKSRPTIGRPVIGPEIKVRISKNDLEALDDLAEETGQSRAATARRLISNGLLAREKPMFVQVAPEKATHTIEAYRWGADTIDGTEFIGDDLAIFVAENTLDDDIWEWLDYSGINRPDVWFLVCLAGEGLAQRPIAALPIAPSTHVMSAS